MSNSPALSSAAATPMRNSTLNSTPTRKLCFSRATSAPSIPVSPVKEASFDLPFTVGLFPLFLQNGIWANDAILGGAVTLPAKNSAALGLANFDITFFAAFDNVDNASVIGADGKVDNDSANLYGVTTFIDAFSGYIEAGYGLVQGYDDQ